MAISLSQGDNSGTNDQSTGDEGSAQVWQGRQLQHTGRQHELLAAGELLEIPGQRRKEPV